MMTIQPQLQNIIKLSNRQIQIYVSRHLEASI